MFYPPDYYSKSTKKLELIMKRKNMPIKKLLLNNIRLISKLPIPKALVIYSRINLMSLHPCFVGMLLVKFNPVSGLELVLPNGM